MNNIPKNTRKEIADDPFYLTCAFFGQFGHTCQGRVTMDHAIEFAGKQLQAPWAVVPICAQGHGVDEFQGSATVTKELRSWVALNRATDDELKAISKVPPGYVFERNRLNDKYGVYERKIPTPADLLKQSEAGKNREWYLLDQKDIDRVEKIRAFSSIIGTRASKNQIVANAIEDLYLSISNHLVANDQELYSKLGFDLGFGK